MAHGQREEGGDRRSNLQACGLAEWRTSSKRSLKGMLMDATKRKAIEAAGWKVGDAADFLGMSDEERQLLDARMELARAIRWQRKSVNMTQKQLGEKLKTSQPRVVKIERAAADVSLDQLVLALTAAGGRIVIRSVKPRVAKGKRRVTQPDDVVVEVTTSE